MLLGGGKTPKAPETPHIEENHQEFQMDEQEQEEMLNE
jgi:hypothetical protein